MENGFKDQKFWRREIMVSYNVTLNGQAYAKAREWTQEG